MNSTYEITIAGVTRHLPICKVSDTISFAGFVILGDVEMTQASARELCKKIPEHDIILTAESKGIPIAAEITAQLGRERYVVARKAPKLYMHDIFEIKVKSISTAKEQTLLLDGSDAELLRGKRVLIVDDVVSTGESLEALKKLAQEVGCEVVGSAAILAEGDAAKLEGLVYLEELPLFDSNGNKL